MKLAWLLVATLGINSAHAAADLPVAMQQVLHDWQAPGMAIAIVHDQQVLFVGGMGKRKLGDVSFPSGKVQMYDGQARHFQKRQYFFAYAEAKQPLLMFDQSVNTRKTGDANPGFNPSNPTGLAPTVMNYDPDDPPNAWEAPNLQGTYSAENIYFGRYQWTRAGLKGIDYGGGEVPWRGS